MPSFSCGEIWPSSGKGIDRIRADVKKATAHETAELARVMAAETTLKARLAEKYHVKDSLRLVSFSQLSTTDGVGPRRESIMDSEDLEGFDQAEAKTSAAENALMEKAGKVLSGHNMTMHRPNAAEMERIVDYVRGDMGINVVSGKEITMGFEVVDDRIKHARRMSETLIRQAGENGTGSIDAGEGPVSTTASGRPRSGSRRR